MTVYQNLETFAGMPVADYKKPGDIARLGDTAPRLRCEYGEELTLRDYLAHLLAEPDVAELRALVLGLWSENGETYEVSPAPAIEMLVAAKDRLPKLEALFSGDIVSEENEISWIEQGDYAAIWAAFPRLARFGVRGGNQLSLGTINHQTLHTLIVEAGGLPRSVVREALAANAPIRHFELWLGSDEYGADTNVADFEELLGGGLFPQLHTLGLRNSQYSDDLAEAIAKAPLLERIKVLDLSMGTLSERGARALAQSGRLGGLERLDITHHYVADDALAELRAATPNLVADKALEPDEYDGEKNYYIAVAE